MNKINITIKGQVGTGKTTICQLIEKTLVANGFLNINITGEEQSKLRLERTYPDRIKHIDKDKILINIETAQEPRTTLTIKN